ncbi:MAG: hypothetical protein RL377_456 [Bacteroidota bacterium]|jgi:hypothetical protein
MKKKTALNLIVFTLILLIMNSQNSSAQRGDRMYYERNRGYERGRTHEHNEYKSSAPYGAVRRTPSVGIRLNILPRGYWSFRYRNLPYHYYAGLFYRTTYNNFYEEVEPPLGAWVPNLPVDASLNIIDGQRIYQYRGTYFKEEVDYYGVIRYRVVGKAYESY